MPQILQAAAIAAATLGTGAATLSVMNGDIPDLVVPPGNWTDSGFLDDQTFNISAVDLDSGSVHTDTLLFRDGLFQSVDCEAYCNFGWSGYKTKTVDDVTHFTATTRCPDAPHTVVWYGTITDDGALELSGTWTTRRWYWSHQIRFSGDGATTPPSGQDVTG